MKLLTILVMVTLYSCTNKQGAKRALEDAGYHPIEVGGYSIWKCSEDDWYRTKFKAYSADSSRVVTGCVCEGLFHLKGKTIRLD